MWTHQLEHQPQIRVVMTPFPHSIDAQATLADANVMMKDLNVRHLPVMDGDQIVGVISERDVMRALANGDSLAMLRPVCTTCRIRPYVVESHEPLSAVLRHMAASGHGSVLVTRDGRLAGIFTTTDACQRFAELIDSLFDGTPPKPA